MLPDADTIKTVAPLAGAAVNAVTPFINAVIETRLKPRLVDWFRREKANVELEQSLIVKFSDYLERSLVRQSSISTIVFQNQQKQIEELYLPLTLETNHGILPHRESGGSREEPYSIGPIDSYPRDAILFFKRILVVDNAGMGKSTLLRFLFLCCIKQNEGIPIFIDLRQLSANKTLIDIIYDELNPIDEEFNKDFILKLIRRADFVFFFDGYDEIPLTQRDTVTRDLQQFISKAGSNDFILSSRPESSLATFGNFQRFAVRPLQLTESFELIRRYDQSGQRGEELIQKLEGNTLSHVKELLTNPLLVSLLYKSYSYKATVPLRKDIFYRQVYEALFETHDLTKPGAYAREKRSDLNIEDFHRVLRALGYITMQVGAVEYTSEALLSYIAQAKQQCVGLEFKAADFLSDLRATVPLFVRDSVYYRWQHKSIQDYFAANFICEDVKTSAPKILLAMYKSENFERYRNILSLCYDIDYKTFRNILIRTLLIEYIQYCQMSYVNIPRDRIPESDISIRKSLSFGLTSWLGVSYQFSQGMNLLGDFPTIAHTTPTRQSLLIEILLEKNAAPGSSFTVAWGEGQDLKTASRNVATLLLPILNEKQSTRKLNNGSYYVTSLIEINDDPNSVLNQPNAFQQLNRYMALGGLSDKGFDLMQCKSLLKEIEADLAREEQGDSLLAGL